MMTGIAILADLGGIGGGVMFAAACLSVLAAVMAVRGQIGGWYLGRWHFAVVTLAWFGAGLLAAWWQLERAPDAIDHGFSAKLDGVITAVDGRLDSRLRIWLSVTDFTETESRLRSQLEGNLVRLSVKPDELIPLVGSHIVLSARIYPPPPPVLHGARDHGVQARIRGVVASGYVTAVHRVMPPDLGKVSPAVRLGALRQARADRIAGDMAGVAGGVAAALLIGDRRYVSHATYDLFRRSGLAHLLAISGLHMGLLCFGVIGCLRAVMALFPVMASRVPVHKHAAIAGMFAGLCYVLLSGLSVSAIRAFLMAMLILAAWLVDRLGLTLRNVGLAAGLILLAHPFALFSAGFQLSFAATTALVIWFEVWRHRSAMHISAGDGAAFGQNRPARWVADLVLASCLASAATLPLTAQHFGTVTPWGVIANLAGIPLTGLWIMPAGLLVLATQFLPVPGWMSGAALSAMKAGIDLLVAVAGLFADLPAAPLRVPPPGAALLISAGIAMAIGFCFNLPSRMRRLCWLGAAAAVLSGIMLPVWDDGILLARGKAQLVLAGQLGEARVYATGHGRQRPMSGFLADSVTRQMAQPVTLPDQSISKTGFAHHRLRDGRQVTVVSGRHGLSEACRAAQHIVISLVRADYPCRSGMPLISLAGLPRDNYRVTITPGGVTVRDTRGQYLRISPVSLP